MTNTSTVPGFKIREAIEGLLKLSSNFLYKDTVKQQEIINLQETIANSGHSSVERATVELRMAEYFSKHKSGSSKVLTEFAGGQISLPSLLSLQGLGLVGVEEDSHNIRDKIYYRTLDGKKFSEDDKEKVSIYEEKVSTYINLKSQFIEEIKKTVK